MHQNSKLHAQADAFLENILWLIHLLRGAGIPVSSGQVMDFTRALTLVKIGEREQVYHAARCILVSRYEHLRLFETIFNLFWKAPGEAPRVARRNAPPTSRHHPEHQPALVTYMARKAHPTDPDVDVMDKTGAYSDLEILQRKDFSQMTAEELEAVKRFIQEMRWQACLRRTRRKVVNPSGHTLHMRRVMASVGRHAGAPAVLAWQSRKLKSRPIVLIADISGSMEKYSRLALQFAYSLSHSLKQVECFLFGTRLTRVTAQLKLKNIDRAVSDAAREVMDWSGGTRIGESLATFNHRWSRRVLGRGAIILIVSDGWERGDVATLRAQVRYLQLRCHRLIWLNPLSGKPNYQPLAEGMAAVQPYVDDFLPIHNLQSLSTLATHLANL
jgi:uncharacterized protein with von Willebrand factor type A (vWA) domain